MRKSTYFALIAIALTGLAIRGFYLSELHKYPDFKYPLLDHLCHDYWARLITFSDSELPAGVSDPMLSSTPYFRPLGYPLFLAGIYRFLGTSPYTPRVVQMILGVVSCLVGFVFCRRWLGTAVALGQLSLTHGENRTAFSHFSQALQLDPDSKPAKQGLQQLSKQPES